MTSDTRVAILGFGRIGQYVADRIVDSETMHLDSVYVRDASEVTGVDAIVTEDPTDIATRAVDLVIEAAHADIVSEYGERVLQASDLLVLSTTALATESLTERLEAACADGGTRLYVPHGAVLGTDGLQDGRPSLESVSITTRKNPANIDFSNTAVDSADIDDVRTLYDGPTRGICAEFPRNVNSHATVAIAGLGFDKTTSTLIADPAASEATHRIVAEGSGTKLEITRVSSIEGVTGSYTLDSVWGTIERITNDRAGITVR